jgi:hypothetical protein
MIGAKCKCGTYEIERCKVANALGREDVMFNPENP